MTARRRTNTVDRRGRPRGSAKTVRPGATPGHGAASGLLSPERAAWRDALEAWRRQPLPPLSADAALLEPNLYCPGEILAGTVFPNPEGDPLD